MTDHELACWFLDGVTAHDGAVVLRQGTHGGSRLWIQPVSVYRLLSPEMLEVLRTHRAAIKDAVRNGTWTPSLRPWQPRG